MVDECCGNKKREIGIGIIGYGFMGKAHTYGYQTIPLYYQDLPFKTKLIGVCNRSLDKAIKAKEELGFEFATNNSDDLFARDDIDVINICTPNAAHAKDAIKAISAGKHVYCDKPMTISVGEAEQIGDAIREQSSNGKRIVFQMAFQNRFFPSTMRAKQIMESGVLGRITAFRAEYLHASSIDPNKTAAWRHSKSEGGGGVLYDLGSHVCDLVHYLLGDFEQVLAHNEVLYPERVDKNGQVVEILNEDHSLMMVKMRNGATGTVEATKVATGSNDELRMEIHGLDGAIRFNLLEPNWLEYYDNRVPEGEFGGLKGYTRIECVQRYAAPGGAFPSPKQTIGWMRSHVHCLYSFINAVHNNLEPSPSYEDGLYMQRFLETAYVSSETETWEKCTF